MTCGIDTGTTVYPNDPDSSSILISAAPAYGGIDVWWTYPSTNPEAVSYYILYRGTSPDPALAVNHRKVNGDFFHDSIDVELDTLYYYWVKSVSINKTESELIGPASATARPTIEQTLELLTGQITSSELGLGLSEELGRIDTLSTDLAVETAARIADYDQVTLDLQTFQNDLDGQATLLTNEVSRLDNEDSALLSEINILGAKTEDNYALIVTEQQARADGDSALASDLSTLIASSAVTYYQDTAPDPALVTLNEHDIWVDTTDPGDGSEPPYDVYQWDGLQWVPTSQDTLAGVTASIEAERLARVNRDGALAQDISTLEATVGTKSEVTFSPTAPSTPSDGDWWIDTDNNDRFYIWNGAAAVWQDGFEARIDQALQDAAIAFSAASTAQSTADGKIESYWQDTQPTASGTGDIWFDTADQNHPYRWDGTSWVDARDDSIADAFAAASTAQSTADGKVTTFYQTTAPTAEGTGDLWVDTDDGNRLHRWNGTSWTDIRDSGIASALQAAADAQAAADGKIVSYWQSTEPTGSAVGDLWFDTDDQNRPYRWDGTAWTDARDSSIADAFAAASTAQETADGKVTTFYQNTAPTAEGIGDLWVDTADGNRLYRWNGTEWGDIQDADIGSALQAAASAQETADGKIESYWQTMAPTASGVGDIWFDTSDQNRPYRWDGVSWVDARDSQIADALDAASTAQSTADGKITTFYQTTAPAAEGVGDLWVDTDDNNRLYRWDGTSWTDAHDPQIAVGASRNQVFRQTTAPTADNIGDLWFDTDDDDRPYAWSGTAWEPVNLYTGNQVTAAIEDNNVSMVGYCEVAGSPDSNYQDPTSCASAGGTWLPAEPLAEATKKVQVSDGSSTATVEQQFTTHQDNLGSLNSQYTVKIDTNGGVAGFGLASTTTGNTTDPAFSEFYVNADRFAVMPQTGTTADAIAPFIVEGGVVYINEGAINQLTFSKLRNEAGSVVVENDKLKADNIDVDNLYAKHLKVNDVANPVGLVVKDGVIKVYDSNGVLRVQIGDLTQ